MDKKQSIVEFINANPAMAGFSVEAFFEGLRGALRHEKIPGISETMTVREFYFAWYKPQVSLPKNVSKDTMIQRETAIRLWEKHTRNPRLCDINITDMNAFVVNMRLDTWGKIVKKRHSEANIKKHCSALMSIISHAGPRSRDFRAAVELIPLPDCFPHIEHHDDVTWKTPTLQEFEKVLAHCGAAQQPKLPDISPAEWWYNAYLFIYNTGVRRGTLLGAQWKDIQQRYGKWVLVVPPEKEKMHVERLIPLNTHAVNILNDMPRNAPDDCIFQFPFAHTTFQKNRDAIIAAAGLDTMAKGTWHAIRRLVGSTCENAQKVLGHTNPSTTRNNYQSIETIARALDKLEQPQVIRNDTEF